MPDNDGSETGVHTDQAESELRDPQVIRAAKQKRSTSKRLFTMSTGAMSAAISRQESIPEVHHLFTIVDQRFTALQERYADYLSCLLSDDDETPETESQWIEGCTDAFIKAKMELQRYQESENVGNDKETPKLSVASTESTNIVVKDEVKRAKRAVKFERSTLQSRIQNLNSALLEASATASIIKDTQTDMKTQLEKYLSVQRELIVQLSDDEEADQEMLVTEKMQAMCVNASVKASKIIQEKTPQDVAVTTKQTYNRGGLELKLERMRLPHFSGEIRDYPRFKQEFEKYVMPSIKRKEESVYVLKSCLSKEALELVKNIDDKIEDIWSRLEDRYGRVSLITRAILFDIKQLSSIQEGEGSKFVELVNIVEKCHHDLESIDMETELSNSTMCGAIEDKLPPTLKLMWSLDVSAKDSKVDERNKFPHLLEFLLKHRRAIEYSSTDVKKKQVKINPAIAEINHVKEDKSKNQQTAAVTAAPNASNEASPNRQHGCWYHSTATHDIFDCSAYKNASINERWDMIMDYRVCWCCLKQGHRQSSCYNLRTCGISGCKKNHHQTLHTTSQSTVNRGQSNPPSSPSPAVRQTPKPNESVASSLTMHAMDGGDAIQVCLLQIMQVKSGDSGEVVMNVFWDSGSKVTMITFKKAKQLGLKGERIRINIIKVGADKETIDSKLYTVPMQDNQGNVHHFKAFGISRISTAIESNDISEVSKLFSVTAKDIERPTGEIDMLIGFEYAGFHPVKKEAVNHLLLMENQFGLCLGGSHQLLREKTKLTVQDVEVSHAAVNVVKFFEHESLGVSCEPKCGSCRCGECPIGGKQYTLQQERELAMIEKGLELHEGVWTARYPWQKDPNLLPDNRIAALAILKSTEKRLNKNPDHAATYCAQMVDMQERGVARKLTIQEKEEYEGPIHYLSHHEVLKPESESTPCRIVFNSSAKFMNQSLNDYWVKGPDLINNLLGVLIRFRENVVGVAGDISKMYHTVKISELDQHTHRFLWRNMEDERCPDTYIITSVSFGDKPAGAIASLALRKTAELYADQSPVAAQTVIKNSYVDDIVDSFESHSEAENITSEIDTVIAKGGFSIKKWTLSSSEEASIRPLGDAASIVADESSAVLGVVWNAATDNLQYRTKINFSSRKRNLYSQPNLTQQNVTSEVPSNLTRRMILSMVNGIYDPMGLAVPFVVQAKIMLRVLTQANTGWDDAVPDDERNRWVSFFYEAFEMEHIEFPRSTKPLNAVGAPILVIFSDASEDAYGACAYVRWRKLDGSYESRLLLAKSRLAPTKKITIPRLELNGALLAARLKKFISKEMRLVFAKIYCIVDSEIVRAMIQKESYGFNTFAGVRIGEIQDLTEKSDWYWIEGSLNIADIITRGCSPSVLGEGSVWQTGPVFLRDPEGEWPLKQSFTEQTLPETVVMAAQATPSCTMISDTVKIDNYSCYDNLIRVTARVISVFAGVVKSLKNIASSLKREDIRTAEIQWIKDAQVSIAKYIKPETMRRLGVHEIDGIQVAGGRLENWSHHTYNNLNPALLSAKSRLAYLYALKVHNKCHLGVSAVMVKIRCKFWIVGLRGLVKSIRRLCTTCRKLDKALQQQIMGQIPEERLKPAPAWSYVSLDLFGPFKIRGETNKRSRSKAYGVIFDCLLCRSVHLELVTDYSTEAFLLSVRRFMALRGCPLRIRSDRGSQLVAANKEMKEIVNELDHNLIQEFGSAHSIDWEFSAADAPWQNGCAEALVKSAKKSITVAIGSQVISFSEMQTVLYECANLLNERPIGRHPASIEDGNYLCPNDLLLGRSSSKIIGNEFSMTTNRHDRYRFVQKIISAFWAKWTRDFFPSLTVWPKWHTARRNVKVGDVVVIQDSNQIRGKWKLGIVSKAESSLRDGFVRNVEIQYKNKNALSFTTITRPVQRIIVLVPASEGDA